MDNFSSSRTNVMTKVYQFKLPFTNKIFLTSLEGGGGTPQPNTLKLFQK